ncbi:hypothetical protein [Limnoraphis robusta]|uniref:Uncharacterized protein n=1 Tax=Limnoraphis robusta CCNP1315 TaxID=3110306 RepID=A0ABU5U2C8_9CYAN|nr:hypothetical protein [Limnoraphis robusta]MEA5498299.1 hypothetical protein [Limnoraphis robusta BA-68 BA1]MEA5521342.1 hypothetical protein [Limnoraphis robusta CCNP1315]MEA5547981.1 hypothetical protein [Limnoraphis robusta CCNP1324]
MKNKLLLVLAVGWVMWTLTTPRTLAQEQLSGNKVYLDKNCQRQQQLPPVERFTVFYQSEFQAVDEIYWFSAGRYQDGAVLFCISQPNFNQAQVLNEKTIQNQFIEKIIKAPNSNSIFLITVAEGNGRNVPLTDYKLDLFDPNQPVLTRLGVRSN